MGKPFTALRGSQHPAHHQHQRFRSFRDVDLLPSLSCQHPWEENTLNPACSQAGWCSQSEPPALPQTLEVLGWWGSQDTSEKLLKMCPTTSVFLVLRPACALLGVTKLAIPFCARAPQGVGEEAGRASADMGAQVPSHGVGWATL